MRKGTVALADPKDTEVPHEDANVEGATRLAKQQKESFFLSLPQSYFFYIS